MLYLAIDQHKAQLTVNIRSEYGDVVRKAKISTKHADMDDFSARSQKKHEKSEASWPLSRSAPENMYSNDRLLEKLKKEKCNEIVVIQPDNSSNTKTDSKDANALCELLWNNRKRHGPSPYRAKQSRSNSETNDRNLFTQRYLYRIGRQEFFETKYRARSLCVFIVNFYNNFTRTPH